MKFIRMGKIQCVRNALKVLLVSVLLSQPGYAVDITENPEKEISGSFYQTLIPSNQQRLEIGTPINEALAKQNATNYIEQNLDSLGIQDSQEYKLRNYIKDRHGRMHVYFSRYIGDVRVDNEELNLHIDPNGGIFAVNGYRVKVSELQKSTASLQRQAYLTETEAHQHVFQNLFDEGKIRTETKIDNLVFPQSELVIQSKWTNLVWKVSVGSNIETGSWLYYVDAVTGDVMSSRNSLQN